MSDTGALSDSQTAKFMQKVQSIKVLIFGIASILIFFVFYICWPSQEKNLTIYQ